jgi:hypothetical protein
MLLKKLLATALNIWELVSQTVIWVINLIGTQQLWVFQGCSVVVFALFLQASVVLGQFLVLKKNKELFQDWLKDVCGANAKQSSECYQCLADWCDEFL